MKNKPRFVISFLAVCAVMGLAIGYSLRRAVKRAEPENASAHEAVLATNAPATNSTTER